MDSLERALSAVLVGSVILLPTGELAPAAFAQNESAVQACAQAYEQSQVDRNAGKLQSAQEQLRICVRDECPDFVRTDCGRWLSELGAEMPSVIFAAIDKTKKKDLFDVKVTLDGEVVTETLDGRAIEVDPGRHQLVCEHQGMKDEQTVLVVQGQKNRVVRCEFATEGDADEDGLLDSQDKCPNEVGTADNEGCPASVPPPASGSDGVSGLRIGAYVGWGVGALGFASTLVLFPVRWGVEDDARKECPLEDNDCTPERIAELKSDAQDIADLQNIGWPIGIAGAVTGTVLFWLSLDEDPPAAEASEAAWRFDAQPIDGGGLFSVSGAF